MKHIITLLLAFASIVYSHAQTITPLNDSMNVERAALGAHVLADGKIFVTCGEDYSGMNDPIATSELYDPNTGTWHFTDTLNSAPRDFTTVKLHDGRVMRIGGSTGSRTSVLEQYITCEIFDPSTGTWSTTDSLVYQSYSSAAVVLKNGDVLVSGGSMPGSTYTKVAQLYLVETNEWVPIRPMNIARYRHSLTLLDDGRVLVVDGYRNNTADDAELFDPVTRSWTKITSSLLDTREKVTATQMTDGRVLIECDDNSEVFDPTTQSFSTLRNKAFYRWGSRSALMHDGRVLIYGANDYTASDTKVIEMYDPTTNSWSHDTYTVFGRSDFEMVRMHDGSLYVIGGDPQTSSEERDRLVQRIDITETGTCGLNRNLTVSLTNSSVCKGKTTSIQVSNSEAGVNYCAVIADKVASNTIIGGGNISIAIDPEFLATGNNVIQVRAMKPGCNSVILENYAVLDVQLTNTFVPEVTNLDSTLLCNPSTVQLQANSSNVIWNTGSTSPSINVSSSGSYSFRQVDSNGCLSAESELEYVYIYDGVLPDAGVDKTICYNATIQLVGVPMGGYWTGPGIDSAGLFTGVGLPGGQSYTVEYNLCGRVDEAVVSLLDTPQVTFDIVPLNNNAFQCNDDSITIEIVNRSGSASWRLYVNDTSNSYHPIPYAPSGMADLYVTLLLDTTSMIYVEAIANCSTVYLDSILIHRYNYDLNPVIKIDTFCNLDLPYIQICDSDPNSSYRARGFNGSYHYFASDHFSGNGDTIEVLLDSSEIDLYPFYNASLVVYDTSLSCSTIVATGITLPKQRAYSNFTLNFESVAVGDTFNAYLGTNWRTDNEGHWYVNDTLQAIGDSVALVVSRAGVNEIELFAQAEYETCKDSMTHTVEAYAITESSNGFPGTVCSIIELDPPHTNSSETGLPYTAMHVDASKNKFLAANVYVDQACSYSGGFQFILTKYDSMNNLVWSLDNADYAYVAVVGPSYADICSAHIMDIETDGQGNIYISGNTAGDDIQILGIPISNYGLSSNSAKNRAFIAKLNPMGVAQWVRYSHAGGPNYRPTGFTDIYIENDTTIYLAKLGLDDGYLGDTTAYNDLGESLSVVKIDSSGAVDHFWTVARGDKYVCCEDKMNYSYVSPRRYARYGGKLLTTPCGDISMFASVYDSPNVTSVSDDYMDFGNGLIIDPLSGYYSNFMAVVDPTDTAWSDVVELSTQTNYTDVTEPRGYLYDWPNGFSRLYADNDSLGNYYVASVGSSTQDTIGSFRSDSADVYQNSYSQIAKYSSSGQLIWQKVGPGMQISDIVVVKGQLVIFGEYSEFMAIEDLNGELVGRFTNGRNGFLASLSLDGALNWIEDIGVSEALHTPVSPITLNLDADRANRMVADKCNGKLYLIGKSRPTNNLMGQAFNPTNGTDGFYFAEVSLGATCSSNIVCNASAVVSGNATIANYPANNFTCEGDTLFVEPVITASTGYVVEYEVDEYNGNGFVPIASSGLNYAQQGDDLKLWDLNLNFSDLRINVISPACGLLNTDVSRVGALESYRDTVWVLTCDSALVNGIWYPGNVAFNDTFQDAYGCDSFVTTIIYLADDFGGYAETSTGDVLANSKAYLIRFDDVDSTLTAIDSTITQADGYFEFILDLYDNTLFVKLVPDPIAYPNEIPTYLNEAPVWDLAYPLVCDTNDMNPTYVVPTLAGINPGGPGFVGGFINQGAGKINNGVPEVGLVVIIVDANGDIVGYTTTNNDGYFYVDGLECGTYTILVDHPQVSNLLAPEITLTAPSCSTDSTFWEISNGRLLESELNVSIAQHLLNSSLSIIPNPTQAEFFVSLSDWNDAYQIEVYNLVGEKIYEERTATGTTSVNCSSWAAGLFYVYVKDTDGNFIGSSKLVVDR